MTVVPVQFNVESAPRPSVVFGAAGSGKNFLKNTGYIPDYLTDNDKQKWNTFVAGLRIVPPNIVPWLTVRSVILASGETAAISSQLKAFGLGAAAIIFPPKALWGPQSLRKEPARRAALELMSQLMRPETLQFPVVAIFGAALGCVRSGDLIPWDEDIDLVAFASDRPKIEQFLSTNGLIVTTQPSFVTAELRLVSGVSLPLSVEFIAEADEFATWIVYGRTYKFATWRFLQPSRVDCGGLLINVPADPTDYLRDIYGANWRIPDELFRATDYQPTTP